MDGKEKEQPKAETKPMQENVLEKIENRITQIISTEGVKRDNVDYLYKLVDIHKDLKNEHYWKKKEEKYDDEIRRIRNKSKR